MRANWRGRSSTPADVARDDTTRPPRGPQRAALAAGDPGPSGARAGARGRAAPGAQARVRAGHHGPPRRADRGRAGCVRAAAPAGVRLPADGPQRHRADRAGRHGDRRRGPGRGGHRGDPGDRFRLPGLRGVHRRMAGPGQSGPHAQHPHVPAHHRGRSRAGACRCWSRSWPICGWAGCWSATRICSSATSRRCWRPRSPRCTSMSSS